MRILVIEYPKGFRNHIEELFKKNVPSWKIVAAKSVKRTLDIVRKNHVDCIVMHVLLLKGKGEEMIKKLKEESFAIPIMMFTGSSDEMMIWNTPKEGRSGYSHEDIESYGSALRLIDRASSRHPVEKESIEEGVNTDIFGNIHRSLKQWRATIDAITDYIFVTDRNFKIKRVNKSFARKFKKHPREMIGMNANRFIGRDVLHSNVELENGVHSSMPVKDEIRIGDEIYMISVFQTMFENEEVLVHIMKNITEVSRLREQIYQSDKLSSLGLLVSGIAHEINNPLTGIMGYVEILVAKIQVESIRQELKKIATAAERCQSVIESLLYFAHQQTPQRNLANMNEIIDRTIGLRNYWLRKNNVEIMKEYEKVPFAHVDSQQIQHAILNILLNAEQAVADHKGKGKIIFSTTVDNSNKKIIIRVSDNGCGIPEKNLAKIFDPFFTTRAVNEGKGLGLSIVYSIITDNRGTISVESKEGEGTTFCITLPVR